MNRLSNVAGSASTTYNADNEETIFKGASHGYDAAEELTSDGTNT